MIDEIYNSQILGYAARIKRLGRLENPDASSNRYSRLCGSSITVDLKMKNSIVTGFAQEVRACALGQASAAIMAQHVIGSKAEEIKILKKIMLEMLTENGPSPAGKFSDFSCLQHIKHYKVRQASIMLVFEAIVDCIEKIEKQEHRIHEKTEKGITQL
ncbi:MAG: Nitrogen-fixing NifU domain-containing protein [Candidatus Tokpelaia sp. JSC188]|nr:MAG: Nitrogen-fixing NifU domain-containing protein [Candidatus Tokpelaia sp. JSC188]